MIRIESMSERRGIRFSLAPRYALRSRPFGFSLAPRYALRSRPFGFSLAPRYALRSRPFGFSLAPRYALRSRPFGFSLAPRYALRSRPFGFSLAPRYALRSRPFGFSLAPRYALRSRPSRDQHPRCCDPDQDERDTRGAKPPVARGNAGPHQKHAREREDEEREHRRCRADACAESPERHGRTARRIPPALANRFEIRRDLPPVSNHGELAVGEHGDIARIEAKLPQLAVVRRPRHVDAPHDQSFLPLV